MFVIKIINQILKKNSTAMNILITGATGVPEKRMVKMLFGEACSVTGLSHTAKQNQDNYMI